MVSQPASTIPSQSSSPSGWLARARPHPDPASFRPSRSHLVLLVSSDSEPDTSFRLALFRSRIAVLATGEVLILDQNDWRVFKDLAITSKSLPRAGFHNTWCMFMRSASTLKWFAHIPSALSHSTGMLSRHRAKGDNSIIKTGVYGFTPKHSSRQLTRPVGDITELPLPLHHLFSLALEAPPPSSSVSFSQAKIIARSKEAAFVDRSTTTSIERKSLANGCSRPLSPPQSFLSNDKAIRSVRFSPLRAVKDAAVRLSPTRIKREATRDIQVAFSPVSSSVDDDTASERTLF